ncbi:hypothetical protein V2A60_006961 [Cordyceps javanica]|uniref:Phospholipase A2 n=1 Tax=Cordyceps javanica TaxID=43265 RepID=A0A545US38_9HYPO|nr:phospholipase A2 [Cordyceps javanica]TQW04484.1 phospholipase A2 [Cordyceps javanica]
MNVAVIVASNSFLSSNKYTIYAIIMKLIYLFALPVALAFPASLAPRETKEQITDRYLFSTALPAFLKLRAQRDPNTLDWESDGCTSAPDNPFNFPFEPACQRHDFGYRNYKVQGRFDSSGRYLVDVNFQKDMLYQCEEVSAQRSCHALASVYYYAVRAFGGFFKRDASGSEDLDTIVQRGSENSMELYQNALEKYIHAVLEDQADGLLPSL